VEFGFSLPGRGPLATPDTVLRMATKADALRYDSVFVTDHVVLPASMARSVYPYATTGQLAGGAAQDYLEPFALLGWLAHATKRIRLGTSVLVVPYRNPLVTAKMLATLDRLSRGRMILGAGVGWLREEFEALAAPPFEARGAVTDEYLRLMRLTWTSDPVRFEGTYYRVSAVHALPKPAQTAGIPIWIGGHTDAALKRAGTLGDGWHPIGLRAPALLYPDEYAAKAKQVHAWAQRAGRDPKAVTLTFRCPMEVRSKRQKAAAGDRPLFQGTADEVAGDIRTYAALGVSHFVFDPTHQEAGQVLANIERFADEVRPKAVRAETVPPARRAVTSSKAMRAETGGRSRRARA
jgi:probable F420-dependent oxidoreductase